MLNVPYNTRKKAADRDKSERATKENKKKAFKKMSATKFKQRKTLSRAPEKYKFVVFILYIHVTCGKYIYSTCLFFFINRNKKNISFRTKKVHLRQKKIGRTFENTGRGDFCSIDWASPSHVEGLSNRKLLIVACKEDESLCKNISESKEQLYSKVFPFLTTTGLPSQDLLTKAFYRLKKQFYQTTENER